MDYYAGLAKYPNLTNNYDSEPVVVIDGKAFKHNTTSYDLRYNAQEGAFIFFLNEQTVIDSRKNQDLDCKHLLTNKLNYRRILSVNKLTILFLLANNGITNVTIYPDKDMSHEINKINSKLSCISKMKEKLKCFNNSLQEYLKYVRLDKHLTTADISNIQEIAKTFIDDKSMIAFLLSDYINILVFRNEIISRKDYIIISNFNSLVDNLVYESGHQKFRYLIITYNKSYLID